MPTSKAKKVAVGVGLGVAAASAAAAGYYFFGSKQAAKHRRVAAKWALDLKRDVVAKARKVKVLDEKVVKKIVAETSKAYATLKDIDKKDLNKAMGELQKNWQAVRKEAAGVGKRVAVAAKKAAKKATVAPIKGRR